MATMNVEDDPYVLSLREQLHKLPPGPDRTRTDQKLSKTIRTENTFTHKGLNDLVRAAEEICWDIGPWAADWYIEKVIEKAKLAASPYQNIFPAWQDKEKRYLLAHLNKVIITAVSYDPQDIYAGISAKVQVLVRCLKDEKANTEAHDDFYSGLIFVTRRDSVITLAEVLSHHPDTKDLFNIGYLLGTSKSAYRHSFLDITRTLQKQAQEDTLSDFKIGEKNLIISTSVAEEGIDVQACGCVIRWDPPANMVRGFPS
jgi:ERCC4-related helicase